MGVSRGGRAINLQTYETGPTLFPDTIYDQIWQIFKPLRPDLHFSQTQLMPRYENLQTYETGHSLFPDSNSQSLTRAGPTLLNFSVADVKYD